MAQQDFETVGGFGDVNRTVGTVFRYLLLGATLVGIVVLAVLLVLVTNDAVQPLTADPGWLLTFLVVLVLPSLGVVGWLLRRGAVAAVRVGVAVLGLFVVSLMFSGGVAMLFVDILSPLTWVAYLAALGLPALFLVGLDRTDRRPSFVVRTVGVLSLGYVALFGVFGPVGRVAGLPTVAPSIVTIVESLSVVPQPWLLVALTVGLGVGAVAGRYAGHVRTRRVGLLAGGAVLLAVVAAGPLGPILGLDPLPATVLVAVTLCPTGVYVWAVAVDRPSARVGLALPATVVGGALLGAVVVARAGFAGPRAWVDWQFLTSPHSGSAAEAGLYPAIGGSLLLMITVAALSFPLGVGAAVYLEEYAPNNRFVRLIDVNISNLAGVPSVVYGLLGLGVFVTYLGRAPGTVLIGGATLALLILPIVIISAREAIRGVPDDLREASYGMGATRWQTQKHVVLPRAFPGILTGTILALGRAIGETAPLIMIGAPNVLFSLPTELSAKTSAMPLQVYAWASLFASEGFYTRAVPAGVVVLVGTLLAMNSIAIVLRNRYQNDR